MLMPEISFKEMFAEHGFLVGDRQYDAFLLYAETLIDWNSRVNLTKITAPAAISVKHFLDSVLILKYSSFPQNAAVIDVGAGAGFPGFPLKIMRADLNITALDSRGKRVAFLQTVSDELKLDAVCLNSRAEDAGRDLRLRERYDVAVARAVAPLPVLCEYCLPFVRVGGVFLAMKGPNEDSKASGAAAMTLGGEITAVSEYNLPGGESRSLITIAKVKPVPVQYPRSAGKIIRHPL
jgi:16S rRNA (guanine527-N7)-methyltransferase